MRDVIAAKVLLGQQRPHHFYGHVARLQDRVVKLAQANKIPVQYGVTGGGNDGAVFTRFGSVDVAMGWPLRYSHSPGEVIDTRDLYALGGVVAVIAKSW